jgi:hypothetical protein
VGLIDEKNRGSKISCNFPFNVDDAVDNYDEDAVDNDEDAVRC